MEEYDGEMRRRQREEEREKRRVRDRERRQSMSEEQREKHLARRRRNYQLRRQRAAATNNNNYNNLFIPQQIDSEDEHPTLLSSSLSDYSIHNGSSVHLETLAYKPTLQRTFRLNHIKQLARNLMTPILADHDRTHTHTHQFGIHQVAPELIPKGHLSANGSMEKSLRLNRVKQLARSLSSASKESLGQNQNGSIVVDAAHHTSFQTQTYANGFKCC